MKTLRPMELVSAEAIPRKRRHGFTLIELLVVIAVIAVDGVVLGAAIERIAPRAAMWGQSVGRRKTNATLRSCGGTQEEAPATVRPAASTKERSGAWPAWPFASRRR